MTNLRYPSIKGKLAILIGSSFMILTNSCSQAPEPTAIDTPAQDPTPQETLGTEINIEIPEGDPEIGKLVARRYGCLQCHVAGDNPLLLEATEEVPEIITRGELRIADPAYAGNATTGEEYFVESILLPLAYLVEGYPSAMMPRDYGERMTLQDLADNFAWVEVLE